MRQVISIHVGQGGIQVGDASWQLFCLQHGISPDGTLSDQKIADTNKNQFIQRIFQETGSKASGVIKYTPRALFVDFEPNIIDQMKVKKQNLINSNQSVSGKQDSANIFARGYYSVGKQLIDICLERIKKLAQQCADLQGFLIYNSVGGGTGSGFNSLLIEKLSEQYQRKTKLGLSIFPTPEISNAFVDPYNSILSSYKQLQYMNANIAFDNQALYQIAKTTLGIEKPNYKNINRILAQSISSITASIRYDGALNNHLKEIQTNHVPYPRLNFLFSSYAPLVPAENSVPSQFTVTQMTKLAFQSENMMIKCNPKIGKYMACSLTYRGSIVPKDVCPAICSIKQNRAMQFVDWCPTGFKVGINYQPPTVFADGDIAKMQKSTSTIMNSTAISQLFDNLCGKFDKMYAKRAFVHWYLNEGMDQSLFSDARQDLAALQQDYREVQKQTEVDQNAEEG